MHRSRMKRVLAWCCALALVCGGVPAVAGAEPLGEASPNAVEVVSGALSDSAASEQTASTPVEAPQRAENSAAGRHDGFNVGKTAAESFARATDEGAAALNELIVVREDAASAVSRELDGNNASTNVGATSSSDAHAIATADAAFAEDLLPHARSIDEGAEVERLLDDAYLVRADSAEDAERLAADLSQKDGIAYVQPNYIYEMPENLAEGGDPASSVGMDIACTPDTAGAAAAVTSRTTSVNDPLWSRQSYLSAVGFADAWDTVRTAGTVSVAVLDSTANTAHEDLVGVLDEAHGWDAAARAPYGTTPASNHGTEVVGILAAACDNGRGIAGASYGANIVPINVYSTSGSRLTTTTSVLLRAMEHVFTVAQENPELNLRVVNLSLGGYGDGGSGDMDRAFKDSVTEAVEEHGMVVVAAGGNENTDRVSWPADWEEVVSVVSVDESLTGRAGFSDYNEYKDIAAPGEALYAPTARSNSDYTTCKGTSFSTPIVSAAFALLFAADGTLSASEATSLLYETADDLGAPGRDDEFGWGLLDVDEAVEAARDGAASPSRAFRDVDQNAWYQTPVAYIDTVVRTDLMQGYGGLFRPDEGMTRAEMFTVIYRAAHAGEANVAGEPVENTSPFTDSEDGQFYTAAINWASEVGIAQGSDGLIRPNDQVTREELATLMARYAKLATGVPAEGAPASIGSITDASTVSTWALSSVAWAFEKGIMTGRVYADGTVLLAPGDTVTRAEAAKILVETTALL